MQVPVLSARGILIGSKISVIVFLLLSFSPKLWIEFELWFEEKKTCGVEID